MTSPRVRISFGMIVLNGLPFLRYNLQSLYPFAHEIIVVEGACRAAARVCSPVGHSVDGTLEVLRKFKKEDDPENKLVIVTAEDEGMPDGFWSEKNEMSQAYAKRVTGDYLWQIDVDEFYLEKDLQRLVEILADGKVTAISFPFHNFWGGGGYVMDGNATRRGDRWINRIFKWSPGSQYVTHRPPTVHNAAGISMISLNWLNARQMRHYGISIYHYEMILPIQAYRKSRYYSQVDWHLLDGGRIQDWYNDIYMNLKDCYHIDSDYTHFSWMRRFEGPHPEAITRMLDDISAGRFPGIELRRTDDIEALLRRWSYRWGCCWRLWLVVIPQTWLWSFKMRLRRSLITIGVWDSVQILRKSA